MGVKEMKAREARRRAMRLEMEFLDRLGRWSMEGKPRLELLTRYLESMSKRSNWGDMDPEELQKYVKYHIYKLKGEI